MALWSIGGEEERFAVVRELKPCPVRFGLGLLLGGKVRAHVESCEGGLVVVAEVVEEDAVGACRGNCYDCRGRVVGA